MMLRPFLFRDDFNLLFKPTDISAFLARTATYQYLVVPAAEIRDHETGLVSGLFSWFQSRQLFLETHETKTNSVF